MTETFTIRLLDGDAQLLGWTRVQATAQAQPPHAVFLAETMPEIPITRDGLATQITTEWTALQIAQRVPLVEVLPVHAGELARFTLEPLWIVVGMADVPLPPIASADAKHIVIGIPAGRMGARSPG